MHHPTSRGALAGTRYSSMGPPWRIDPMTHRTMSERSNHGATSRSRCQMEIYWSFVLIVFKVTECYVHEHCTITLFLKCDILALDDCPII